MKHNLDIICLSETYLDSSIQHEDERIYLNGYKLARVDNHNNNTRGGVGIYFKKFLATRHVELNNLNECIAFAVCIQHKKCYLILLL